MHLPKQKAQEMWVCSLGWEDPLEEGMATHSSILSWEVPWTEEHSGIQSMGSQRVGHDWTHTHTCCWKGSEHRLLRTHSSVAVGRSPPRIFWDNVNKISAASPGITVYMRVGRTHYKDVEETCFPVAALPSLWFSLGSPIPPLSPSIGVAPG